MKVRITLVLAALALTAMAPASAFSPEEIRKILLHGPWPPPLRADPGNRVSGRPAAIELGERLFFEPRLSGTGSVLCASCHVPFRGFQDARPRAFGLEQAERNTPSLLNVRFNRRFGWDGARDSLWAQSIRPLLEPREMRATPAHVAAVVRKNYSSEYAAVFGRFPASDEEILVDVGKALAAFQETLVTSRTPFDRVPGLRNVARTAPYMHDGSLATLRDVVGFHSELNEQEVVEVVTFLESLTAE